MYAKYSSPPMTVFTMARATMSASPGLEMDPWEPPLNARKPKNRMNPPRAAFLRVQRKKRTHTVFYCEFF